jgi:hypothetical protein
MGGQTLKLAEYDGFKRDRLTATSPLKQSLRNICSSEISVAKCTNGLGTAVVTLYGMPKKNLYFTGYKLQLLHALRRGDTRKEDIFHIATIKRGFIGKKGG